jgi:hypothetical protein
VNEFSGGVHIDLTAPIASVQAPYSNRLSVEIGLFDYEGDRSEGHFDVRYRLNRPGVLRAEIGVRSTEGVMDLWSAGGGDFNLRLTQLLVRADSPALLPDSLLRASGRFSILSVTDDYGIASGSDHNVGYEIGLSGGYRVLERAWVGLAYSRLDFRSRTDLYFSPESYEATEVYMEYENEMRSAWYLRLRGAIGAVSRSEGIMSKRLEMDLTRRLTDRFSLVLSGTLGNTSRSLGGGASDTFSRYSMVLLSGRLYWLL